MYSSLDNPTYEEWLIEYNRLLDLLKFNSDAYTNNLFKCMETQDAFMMKYYCSKLLDANKRLEFSKVVKNQVEIKIDMNKEWGKFLKENEAEILKEIEKYGDKGVKKL